MHSLTYSVITVCLNSARTIGRTIDSVLIQAPLPAEYIFVDGGSTDGTVGIIQQAIDKCRQTDTQVLFKLLDQAGQRGITSAWNIALDQCGSDIVFILNSDDWYEDHCVRRVLATFTAEPQADIVFASARTYPRGQLTPRGIARNRTRYLLPVLMPFVHPACFVRREVYSRVGYFDTHYEWAADYDFLYRCCLQGVRCITIDEILVNFELGGRGISNRRLARKELLEIGKRHSSIPLLSYLAFLLRGVVSD